MSLDQLQTRRSEIGRELRDLTDPAAIIPLESELAEIDRQLSAYSRAAGNIARDQAERDAAAAKARQDAAAAELNRQRLAALAAVKRQGARIVRLAFALGRAWRTFNELRNVADELTLRHFAGATSEERTRQQRYAPMTANLKASERWARELGEHRDVREEKLEEGWIAEQLTCAVEEIVEDEGGQ